MKTAHLKTQSSAQHPTVGLFALLVAIASLALMSGCGSKTSPRSDLNNGGAAIADGTGALCNSFYADNQARLAGKVQVYVSQGTYVEDKIRVRITTLDSQFDSAATYNIKFFRVKVNSSGVATIDQTPVPFYIEDRSARVITSSPMSSINSQMTSTLRPYAAGSGTTSSEFFNATSFQVTNLDYAYQVLKAVLYDGSTVLAESNFLLPVFTANPNTYASTHPATLYNLHPFYSSRTTNYSDSQWVNLAASNCFQ